MPRSFATTRLGVPATRLGGGARADLVLVLAVVCGFFVLAVALEVSESVARWGSGYEHLQLDELPLTLLVLSVGLAWFAFRRTGEAKRQVAERRRAEARIAELLAHNRELAQGLLLAQENERRALARELHDEIGQNCTAIRAEASFISHAAGDDRAGVIASAARIGQISEELYGLVRTILRRLRPMALDSLGLESALQELCESWEEQCGIACGFFPRDLPAELDDGVRIAVFRLVQESLTNVARHAGADQVRIDLAAADGCLRLIVADNGRGLADPERVRPGFGLVGMRERVAGLHGQFRLISQPGQGLRIEVDLPLKDSSP